MKKPWHIWMVFVATSAIVVIAMGWLSVHALEADRERERDRQETELARQQAELQERVSSALYRMDLKMLPLVGQEAARPWYDYQSDREFLLGPDLPVANDSSDPFQQEQQLDLPLQQLSDNLFATADPGGYRPLLDTPAFVRLHFQVMPDGTLNSPQVPEEQSQMQSGDQAIEFDKRKQALQNARQFSNFDQLVMRCAMPAKTSDEQVVSTKSNVTPIYSVPAVEKIRKQLAAAVKTPQQGKGKFKQQVDRGYDRGNKEFSQRSATTKGLTDQQISNNALLNSNVFGNGLNQIPSPTSPTEVAVGTMQPMWIDDQLILARRVDEADMVRIQVCWLDWPAIKAALRDEVSDLLPEVSFLPLRDGANAVPGMTLTTLPIQLEAGQGVAANIPMNLGNQVSALVASLLLAWLGVILAILASAFLLQGVIRLSERRATFVSAVTHELRTPLTTFRMYAEMLAERMVPPDKTQQYAQTLQVQADRLSHLVENVLQFARLEKGSQADVEEQVAVGQMLNRFQDRLRERVQQAEMEFQLRMENNADEIVLTTQPARVEQVLFNLVDNACKYGKPVGDVEREGHAEVSLVVRAQPRSLQFLVMDQGPGILPQDHKRLFQAFCKSDQDAANSAPGVGLGLALCRRMATALRGKLYLEADSKLQPSGACFVLEIPR